MEKNKYKERIINLYIGLLFPVGLAAGAWAIYGFRPQGITTGLVLLSVFTVFFSSALRIQLPRTKIHLTVSDSLIFLSMLLYGGEMAVLLGALESAFTSFNLRRQGVILHFKTIVINTLIAVISVFVTSHAVIYIFGPPELAIVEASTSRLIAVLFVMAASQFIVNSVFVAAFIAIKSDESLWRVWNEYCLNALVMYLSGALVAGLITKAFQQIDIFLFASVAGFFGLVYLTYVRYVNDIRKTAAKAEMSERNRAEEAETHVNELEHYIVELELSSQALRESREMFRHAAYHDELTGLGNRNRFLELLRARLESTDSLATDRFAVFFLDLDRFKTVNDSLGHTVGDQLIVGVASRLSEMIGENGMVGRFGGDEFAILLSNIRKPTDATWFAEKVAKTIANPFEIDGRQIFTSVSIGIAFGHSSYEDAGELLRDADIAMYYAKETNKSHVIFDQIMHARAVSLLELETDLRFAIERNEFELYYQPFVSLDDMSIMGFEALVRWNHPSRGLITPGEFISVAESTGLIIPMTILLLRSACRQIVEWERQAVTEKPLIVSVNLSAVHLDHPGIVDSLRSIITVSGVDPALLKLEITESAVMANAESSIEVLAKIKELGVKLSIDDFGTGYSSLSYLHRFPIDTLKIDRSFVSTMEEGSENGEIVRTVIALAKALNLSVIAEGIESLHQFHQLRILGCEYGQGYLFSRPVPVGEANKLLADKTRWLNILPVSDFGVIARNLEYTQLRIN